MIPIADKAIVLILPKCPEKTVSIIDDHDSRTKEHIVGNENSTIN